MHLNSKESRFSPVSSPTVSSNPIFCSSGFINSKSYNCYNVIRYRNGYLWVNSSSIFFKFICGVNGTRDWSSCINFSFHSCSSRDTSVLAYFPTIIFLLCPAIFSVLTFSGWGTVHAFLYVGARKFVRIFGNILLTSHFRNSDLMGKLVDSDIISSIAGSSGFTVDNNLNC